MLPEQILMLLSQRADFARNDAYLMRHKPFCIELVPRQRKRHSQLRHRKEYYECDQVEPASQANPVG